MFDRKKIITVGAIVLCLIIGGWIIVNHSYFDNLTIQLRNAGSAGPLLFVGIYIIATLLLVPISPLSAMGAGIFGTSLGLFYSIIGAMIGAMISFWLARLLSEEWLQKILHDKHYAKFNRYQHQLEDHGFMTTFLLRAISVIPFGPINYLLGVCKIKTSDYFWGTLLGVLPGTIAYSLVTGALENFNPVNGAIGIVLLIGLTLLGNFYYHKIHLQHVTITTNTAEALTSQAAKVIKKNIERLLEKKSHIILGLPGGRSIAALLQEIKKNNLDWSRIHVFIIDERLVNITDPESNGALIRQNLDDVIPSENLHLFIYHAEAADKGINAYRKQLSQCGGSYDILVLSAGEDGHVAGLFPHHSVDVPAEDYFTFDDSPKPPAERMSSSKKLLQHADTAILLFNGDTKKSAYQSFINPRLTTSDCPAKLVNAIPNVTTITNFSN